MVVKQISVFIENKAGRLTEITGILQLAGLNIEGFSIADSTGYGILRLIVNNPDKATRALKKNNFTVNEKEVLCVDLPNKPGALFQVLQVFSKNNLNVEYFYSIAKDRIIFNFDNLPRAKQVLKKQGFKLVEGDKL